MNNYLDHPLSGAFDLDSAMSKLWDFYKKYFVGLYLISIVFTLLSSLVTMNIDIASIQSTTDPEEMLKLMKGMAGPYAITMLITIIGSVMLNVWTLEKPAGEPGLISSLLKKTLLAILPCLAVMIILSIIGAFMIAIGIVLLVLPGLFAIFYIGTVMIFALPLILIESPNPFTVIQRSFNLAHMNFWSNIGWFAVVALIILVISLIISAVTLLPFSGSLIKSITSPEEAVTMYEIARNPVYIAVNVLASSLVTPVIPILAFIMYFRNKGDETAAEVIAEEEPAVRVEDLYPHMPEDN